MKRKWSVDPNRPTCVNIGCDRKVHLANRSSTGRPVYRPVCSACHKSKGNVREGVTGVKKDYCENRDGRLGFECTATIMGYLQLDMDHIDGNHYNNTPENIQTLCKNCHSWKSHVNEDHLNFMKTPEHIDRELTKFTKVVEEATKLKLDSEKKGWDLDFTEMNKDLKQIANMLNA